MSNRRTRTTTQILPMLFAFALAGCGTVASVSSSPAHPTAAAACRALAGEGWQVAVEVDRSDTSALALVSGSSIATCLTTRTGADYGTTSLGVGGYPMPSTLALSYLTSQKAGSQTVLVGRAPSGARRVQVTLADGMTQDASVGNGVWLAWVSDNSDPTLIEAIDASGAPIDRISDSKGIQPKG